jgi:NAD(P)-dependent dehydrogenase (short-subunit alcohol dehydrogenase family)
MVGEHRQLAVLTMKLIFRFARPRVIVVSNYIFRKGRNDGSRTKSKVALLTGVSKGLGKGIAEELAKEGADISICARGKSDLKDAAETLSEYGVRVQAMSAEVTNAADTAAVIEGTINELGGLDILVNNTSDAWFSHMLDTTDEEWRYCLEVKSNERRSVHTRRGSADAQARQRSHHQYLYDEYRHANGLCQ